MGIPSPRSVKEVQKLTERITVLNRFISKSSERCQPFFDTLRKNKNFKWMEKCKVALQQLKTYLSSPPLLSKPPNSERPYVYLAVLETMVSTVLVRDVEQKRLPVYYTSKTLLDAERRYRQMEKLALALTYTAVDTEIYA
ncbi:hypothetical protein ACOSQ4_028646 [Xanthoceras sorbifolium]